MTIASKPLCVVCRHFKPGQPGLPCDAFPKGVPEDILINTLDHRKPVEGDQGVQFEVREGQEAKLEEVLEMIGWPVRET